MGRRFQQVRALSVFAGLAGLLLVVGWIQPVAQDQPASQEEQAEAQPEEQEEGKISLVFFSEAVVGEMSGAYSMESPEGGELWMGHFHTLQEPSESFPVATSVSLDSSVIAANFRNFMTQLRRVFETSPGDVGPFSVDEIELEVSVNADGEVGLIAKGRAGAAGAIRVVLKRIPQE